MFSDQIMLKLFSNDSNEAEIQLVFNNTDKVITMNQQLFKYYDTIVNPIALNENKTVIPYNLQIFTYMSNIILPYTTTIITCNIDKYNYYIYIYVYDVIITINHTEYNEFIYKSYFIDDDIEFILYPDYTWTLLDRQKQSATDHENILLDEKNYNFRYINMHISESHSLYFNYNKNNCNLFNLKYQKNNIVHELKYEYIADMSTAQFKDKLIYNGVDIFVNSIKKQFNSKLFDYGDSKLMNDKFTKTYLPNLYKKQTYFIKKKNMCVNMMGFGPWNMISTMSIEKDLYLK